LKEAVCLPFMFSRIVREDRAARTVLVFGGEAFSFNTVKCELTNTPMKKELYIGLLSSVVISREICNWERFKNRRQVSSYTGLCPGEYSSGSKRALGSVTKHGNRRPRAALVELAWRMARFQPRCHPCRTGSPSWQKEPERPGRNARGPSLPWPASSLWTSGGFTSGAHTHDPRIQVK
jgi:Transposase IS116/IS110/IS902 family